jgi:hypothetical protein
MIIPAFLLLSSALLNTEVRPAYVNISIGAHGPYSFLSDTDAQTNVIDAALAKELRLEPLFRVEIITQNTSRLSSGLREFQSACGVHSAAGSRAGFLRSG